MLNKIIKDAMLFPIFRKPFDVDAAEGTGDYAVLGKNPGLAFDFIQNDYYVDPEDKKTFSDAITHARAGNATMTDGYGPELVVNGGFDSDLSGWTDDNSQWAFSGSKAYHASSSVFGTLRQSLSVTTGKAYEITFDYEVTQGQLRCQARDSSNAANSSFNINNLTGAGSVSFVFIPDATFDSIAFARDDVGVASEMYVDNISVREMPVIKWAPHNLLTYSEDFTNADWIKSGVPVTNISTTLPNGSTGTAGRLQDTGSGILYQSETVAIGQKYTVAVWAKSYDGSSQTFRLFGDSGGSSISSDFTATSEWQLFEFESTVTASGGRNYGITDDAAGTNYDIVVWGAHLYRSDLGGMVDNPDQPLSRASYVPTTSAAKYLPRIGHHVYNGSAWVNEGVLAESESRTNLYDNNDLMHNNGTQNSTLSANGGIAPDGTDDAVKLLETTATSEHTVLMAQSVITTGKTYTCSVFVKSIGGRNAKFGFTAVNFPSAVRINFDLENVTTASPSESTIQEIGNGWYRLSVTATSDATGTRGNTNAILQSLDGTTSSYAGDTSKGLLFYGMQIEEGATPSSYIPTANTTTVTRAAETFTIPSANLPWPTPQYIGSELVTNGTFDSDVSGWTADADGTISYSNGTLLYTGTSTGPTFMTVEQSNLFTAGKVYRISLDLVTSSDTANEIRLRSDTTSEIGDMTTTGTYEFTFVATGSDSELRIGIVGGLAGESFSIDNISVREINPLALSIAMDGAVTYADEGIFATSIPQRWFDSATNKINWELSTNSTDTGKMFWIQNDGTQAARNSGDVLSPDVLVPFNMASRHGSTFINGASDGVTATVNTTPTSLPDLSSADLNLAYDYMGTISEFRVWDRDITDDGLVEATNPSLEPSLSLTFEGTGTNSFVINDWSE